MTTLTRITRTATTFAENDDSRLTAFETATASPGDGNGIEAIGGVPTVGAAGTYLHSNGDGTLSWSNAPGGSVTSFDGLTDCEDFADGEPGDILEIGDSGTELVWRSPPAAPRTTLLELDDTPEAYGDVSTGDVWLRMDPNGGSRLVFGALPEYTLPSVSDLTDTNIESPANQDVLTWNGAQWVNLPQSGGSGGTTTMFNIGGGPGTPIAGRTYLQYSTLTNQVEWVAAAWPETLSGLQDCDTIVGANAKYLYVDNSSGSSRVTLVDPPEFSGDVEDLGNIPALPGSSGNYYLRYNQASDVFTWETEAFTGATQFSELSDGPQDSPSDNDILQWNTSLGEAEWNTLSQAGVPQDLLDITGLSSWGSNGQVLGTTGSGPQWVEQTGGSGGTAVASPAPLIISVSDEDSVITTASPAVTFRVPQDMTISKIKASLTTASSAAGPVTVDVNLNGSSVFGANRLTIDNFETTSETAATAADLNTTAWTDDDVVTVDIANAGTGAVGLKISIIPE